MVTEKIFSAPALMIFPDDAALVESLDKFRNLIRPVQIIDCPCHVHGNFPGSRLSAHRTAQVWIAQWSLRIDGFAGFENAQVAFVDSVNRSNQRLFPNGHHAFHFIDEELAGGECFVPMRRDHFDPERGFIDFHDADPMYESHRFNRPTLFNFLENEFKLALSHSLKRFVFDGSDTFAFFIAADHASKINRRPHAARHPALRHEDGLIDEFAGDGQLPLHRFAIHEL